MKSSLMLHKRVSGSAISGVAMGSSQSETIRKGRRLDAVFLILIVKCECPSSPLSNRSCNFTCHLSPCGEEHVGGLDGKRV